MNDNPDSLSILSQNVDKSQVPPIDQKRMVAFINEFIISTVSFLNEFMTNIETKFVEFELKMQKIEASLMIVEAKMASIPDVQAKAPPPSNDQSEKPQEQEQEQEPQTTIAATQDTPSTSQANETENVESIRAQEQDNKQMSGAKASDDTRYRKYFKMLQFGVPAPAVKLKMANEGFDPNVLDDPNRIFEDGILFVASEE
ncbi:WASH complex subunit 3 [Sitodiplosis mosellana]|uniref:WASH complex subunit 3 n=1 Tax=Sitodiplosis mosellana TaxID=263140 RepID=UPI0024448AC3|nr:WASH complex subunit 3 [Sitodiplosis mosellana]